MSNCTPRCAPGALGIWSEVICRGGAGYRTDILEPALRPCSNIGLPDICSMTGTQRSSMEAPVGNYLTTANSQTCWEVGHVWQGMIDEWGCDIYKQTYHTIHCNLSMDVCFIDISECYLVNSEYLAQLYPECLKASSIE